MNTVIQSTVWFVNALIQGTVWSVNAVIRGTVWFVNAVIRGTDKCAKDQSRLILGMNRNEDPITVFAARRAWVVGRSSVEDQSYMLLLKLPRWNYQLSLNEVFDPVRTGYAAASRSTPSVFYKRLKEALLVDNSILSLFASRFGSTVSLS